MDMQSLAVGMRGAALIIGYLGLIVPLSRGIGATLSLQSPSLTEGSELVLTQLILLNVSVVIAVAGCIVCWWRLRLAGVLLVLAAVGLAIEISLGVERNQPFFWLTECLPLLMAGGLFFGSWQLERKRPRKWPKRPPPKN